MLELRCINNRHCVPKIIVSRGLRRKMNLIVGVQKKTTNSTWYFVVTRSCSTSTFHLVFHFMPKYMYVLYFSVVRIRYVCIFTLRFFTFMAYRLFRILVSCIRKHNFKQYHVPYHSRLQNQLRLKK